MKKIFVLPDGTRLEVEHEPFESYASSPDDTVIPTPPGISKEDLQELLTKIDQIDQLQAARQPISGTLEQVRLQERIDAWPEEWGDYLHVSLFGAIEVASDVMIPELEIEVSSKREMGTFVFHNFWTFPCRIKVRSKDWEGVSDAITRLESFLNAWHITTCRSGATPTLGAGSAIHYYCSLLSAPYAVLSQLVEETAQIKSFLDGCNRHNEQIRLKIMRAAWWMRQARHDLLSGAPNISIFSLYSSYWNAFECLIDVACNLIPPKKLSKADKAKQIQQYVSALPKPLELEVEDILHCYNSIVNLGFPHKAHHVFSLMIDKETGERLYSECFTKQPETDRLYKIRNDIDHGNITEYDMPTRIRVLNGLERLREIVLPLFIWLTNIREEPMQGSGTNMDSNPK
ncbi:MAG: hypothetical protein Q8L41_08835 [Anaerolineales bacterium]|nr:hypothetical protein [Anaerolineales bacterium]